MTEELKILISAVREAGDAILKIQKEDLDITKKANNDIVTRADFVANEILRFRLSSNFKNYGWLSEESIDDAARHSCKRVWIVDPIDGTKEYARGMNEYAISAALVENGAAILAAVFNPATNEFFHAIVGGGSWQDDKKITCADELNTKKILLLASRTDYERGDWNIFRDDFEIKKVGSIAYKLALIAKGVAHATFSLTPKHEWDIAAGTLLVQEAGGIVTTKTKDKIIFNQKNIKVNGIVASCPRYYEKIFSCIENKQHK